MHRIQPTRFLQQALHGECVDFYRNKREEQDSNSFSIFGTSQQRLHVTCPHTYLYATVSCPYEGRAMYTSLIYKAQIVFLCVCVCVCVCMCVRVWRPRLLSVRNRNWHAHSARTEEGLRKKNKKIMHRVPSRGIDPRVKFLDDANATHCSSFEQTPAPVPCRLYASIFVLRKASSNRISLADETYSSSAFVSLQIPIARLWAYFFKTRISAKISSVSLRRPQ